MRRPEISIIIPVYNVERYIGTCIECILNQSFKDYEVILIDDGSIDQSSSICKKYASLDNRIIYYRKENGGQSAARNMGIELSIGDYIMFLDSDDCFAEDALEKASKKITESGVDMLGFNFKEIDENGDIIKLHKPLYTIGQIFSGVDFAIKHTLLTVVWGFIYKSSFLKSVGVKFIEGVFCEDEDFITRIINAAPRVAYVDDDLYCYRIRQSSTVHTQDDKQKRRLFRDTMVVLESLVNYRQQLDNKQKSSLGVVKKIESLTISLFLKRKKLSDILTDEEKASFNIFLKKNNLFPVRIRVNGFKYRAFAFFINRLYTIL